jgi:site-specific DNA-methyltransferase (adenine-specific)
VSARLIGSGEGWAVYHARHAELAAHLTETGVRPDSLIADCPYSERTHRGHDDGTASANRVADWAARAVKRGGTASNTPKQARRRQEIAATHGTERRSLTYAAWTGEGVRAFVAAWLPLVRGWWVSITDHVLGREWEAAFGEAYLYPFAPIPLVEWGSRVRLAGDGPSRWACDVIAARPRSGEWLTAWREERRARGLPTSLPGAYEAGSERHSRDDEDARTVGGKPVAAMRAIVRDYAPLGGLVVDPCCGSGTTGIACVEEGVQFIGGDQDLAEAEKACRRIERAARQGRLFGTAPSSAEQLGLLEDG